MEANRLYNWSEDSIRWYLNAEPYDEFHRTVADTVLSALPERPTVCDVGCGIGTLSLLLAPHCGLVTACDIRNRPLDVVAARAKACSIDSIETLCGDFMKLPVPREKFDALVFCRFGKMQDFAERALEWTKRKVFFIQNASHKHSFTALASYDKSVDFIDGRHFLDRLGVHYTVTDLTAEMGQPFENREDAERFIAFYDTGSSSKMRADYLEQHLIQNNDADFPLFLPCRKRFMLFEIDAL